MSTLETTTKWSYRKKITLTGQSGAGTNYQVFLKVGESSGSTGADFHLGGHSKFPSAKNDGGDLRFTDNDGETLLPFWVEEVSGTSPNRVAKVWVKVKDDLGSNVDIYCYYGNINASNASNGEGVFDFFDDFDGTSLDTSKWSGDTTGFSVSSGNLKGTNTTGRLQSVSSFSYTTIQEVRAKTVARATNGQQIAGFFASTSDGLGFLTHPSPDYIKNNDTWASLGSQIISYNVWYLFNT
mgnify:CR=1 FL=1